jgi:hypothetical protein
MFPPVFFLGLSLSAQDLRKDMDNLMRYYQNVETFKSDVQVKVFKSPKDNSPLIRNASICKKGRDFYYELAEQKMLVSEQSILMVYETQKNIIYKAISKKDYDQYLKNLVVSNLDSIISKYDSVRFEGVSEDSKHYTIYTAKGIISKTDLYLNSNNAIDKVTYFYNENFWGSYFKVQINFKNNSVLSQADLKLFSDKKYITKDGKNIRLAPAFSSYHLILTDYED